jgi:alpha 1,3-glucosidase
MNKIPVFQRGGTIIAKRERARRNSALMESDPFTLVIALDRDASANGRLYLDDGSSFAYKSGAYLLRQFTFTKNRLVVSSGLISSYAPLSTSTAVSASSNGAYTNPSTVERVVIWGVTSTYTRAVLHTAGNCCLAYLQCIHVLMMSLMSG